MPSHLLTPTIAFLQTFTQTFLKILPEARSSGEESVLTPLKYFLQVVPMRNQTTFFGSQSSCPLGIVSVNTCPYARSAPWMLVGEMLP